MKFYYDLSVCPPTYDAVSAACRAEIERRRAGAESIEVVFLPGPAGGFRRDSLWPHSAAERTHMLREVAMPIFMLLPDVSVTLAVDRPMSGLGVGRRMYGLEQQVIASRQGIRPLRAPSRPQVQPRLITLTLREADHWPERNSAVAEWVQAAHTLEKAGYDVIVVRDTLRADEPLDDLQTLPVASRKLFARADLYALAALNLFICNGPAFLAAAMDLPVIIFKRPSDDALGRAFGREHFRNSGMPWGGQMPGAPSYQRIVWQDDTAANIVRAVDEFMVPRTIAAEAS